MKSASLESDAWLLYAVIHASREAPAERNRIVAVADHYIHAVLTQDELEGGLKRLTEAGWIVKKGFSFSGTERTGIEYAGIQREQLNCFDEMKRLQTLLEN